MPHGRHIYANSSDMEKATICSYPESDHALPHWKYVLRCCAKFSSINIPDQETDDQYSNTSPLTIFRIYHIIARCTTHARLLLNDRENIHYKISIDDGDKHFDFYTSFYIPAIHNLAFHIPRVQILHTKHCDYSIRTTFECRE